MASYTEALTEATEFVNRELGLSLKPTLEVEAEPSKVEFVATRFPRQETITVHPVFMPSDKAGQKTVFIHEVGEIGYEQKGQDMPHVSASDFTRKHWQEAGGKSPENIHKELVAKGYYHGKQSPLDLEKMLSGEYHGTRWAMLDRSKKVDNNNEKKKEQGILTSIDWGLVGIIALIVIAARGWNTQGETSERKPILGIRY